MVANHVAFLNLDQSGAADTGVAPNKVTRLSRKPQRMTGKSRAAAVQPSIFAAPLINDCFSRGSAAVEGCVPRLMGGLCKGRDLRIAAVDAVPGRAAWSVINSRSAGKSAPSLFC